MVAFAPYFIPQYRTTTLNKVGGLTAGETTGIVLASIPSDLDITKPGILALTYSNPINTTLVEWITYTSIDGTNELQGVTRGAEGWNAHTHDNGCTIGFVFSKSHINEIMKALTGVTTGVVLVNATLTTPTLTATNSALTTPRITTSINDSSGNEVIKTPATASAVNELTVTNAATGNPPTLSPTGDDTNIDLKLIGKGTGKPRLDTSYGIVTTDSDGATITLDCSVTNRHSVVLGGNRIIALSNTSSGQIVVLDLIQDGTGSRTVTHPTTAVAAITMTIATPCVVTLGKDIPTLTPISFSTSGALPTGLVAGTIYYWVRVSSTTGNLATSVANAQAGTLIATSGSQSGTHAAAIGVRWAQNTAPTLSTGKYQIDVVNYYIKDATNGIIHGFTSGQGL